MSTEMVVCSIYKLLKNGNSYVKDGMKLERDEIIIGRDYVDEKNALWEQNGMWHEIDEDKTSAFIELREKTRITNINNQKIEGQLTKTLTDVIKKANKVNEIEVIEPKIVKKEVVEDVIDEEIEKVDIDKLLLGDLKVEYLDLTGKHVPVNKKNDKRWIYNKIQEEKSK